MSQYSELQASDPFDQLYAQVDKKKEKKKKHGVDSQPSATPPSQAADMAPSEPVDQLYALVDKKQKRKKKTKEPADSHSPETVPSQPPVMELYAQVDKKKKRRKKTTDDIRTILFRVNLQSCMPKWTKREQNKDHQLLAILSTLRPNLQWTSCMLKWTRKRKVKKGLKEPDQLT